MSVAARGKSLLALSALIQCCTTGFPKAIPPRVIQGASVTIPGTVTNSANVVSAQGADPLAYPVGGGGSERGTATASGLAAL